MRGQLAVETIETKENPKDPLAILRYPPSHEHRLIVLDERGKQFASEKFADSLTDWLGNPQIKSVSFLIGGPYGVPPTLVEQAHETWSFSNSTLPSDLAWLVCTEQLYRAHSIRVGSSYHHGDVLK